MFRTLTFTSIALTLMALPATASAQGFFSPFGCANGRCGTSYYRANPYNSAQYANTQYSNQGVLPGGCYGGSCPVNCGANAPCAQHGVFGCQQCQNGVCRQVPCTQHGVVNCPQCQGGLSQQFPSQYNLNGSGATYQPTSNPYFQGLGTSTGGRTRGTIQPAPTLPNWTAPTSSTHTNSSVTLY